MDHIKELRACRVCLAVDTKLYNLHSHKLAETYDVVTGTSMSSHDGLPHHICTICTILLLKCARFRANSKVSEALLKNALSQDTVTTEYIHSIDRTAHKLALSLSRSPTHIVHWLPEESTRVTTRIEEKCAERPKSVLCKVEELLEDQELSAKEECNVDPNPDKPDSDIQSPKFELDDITTDIDDEDKDHNYETEINNETLSKRTRGSLKRKVKEKTKRVASEQINKTNVKNKQKIKKLLTDSVVEDRKSRPGNKPRSEEDFARIAESYNVDIVFLSKEEQMKEMQDRKESPKYSKRTYKCQLCYSGFTMEAAFKNHLSAHDASRGGHVCDVCRCRYPCARLLRLHASRHSTNYVCRTCSHVSKTTAKAMEHFKWHNGHKYVCQYCGKASSKMTTHLSHVRAAHHAQLSECELCGEACVSAQGLKIHKFKAHKQVTEARCFSCNVQFHSPDALQTHLLTSRGFVCDSTMNACAACGNNFPTEDLLTEHLNQQHKKEFHCEECSMSFRSQKLYNQHRHSAHRLPSMRKAAKRAYRRRTPDHLMCEFCGKYYKSVGGLVFHRRAHTGEKPFSCSVCGRAFRAKVLLQVHMRSHSDERPFQCALCPKAFKSSGGIARHRLNVHTSERRFKCHVCDKPFQQLAGVQLHVRTVHMKMPVPPRVRRKQDKKQ